MNPKVFIKYADRYNMKLRILMAFLKTLSWTMLFFYGLGIYYLWHDKIPEGLVCLLYANFASLEVKVNKLLNSKKEENDLKGKYPWLNG